MGFDRRFQRKWVYYFASSEAGFASKELGDLQILLKRTGQIHEESIQA
jgi:cyclopropane fatty-acyl-phospholipid synthase-like methyltransferase